ncbi:aspartate--tRNA(Asn) ligase [bacterium]|nr:MAG: aspartate--tRNA(Asn) ligase [bacterium]
MKRTYVSELTYHAGKTGLVQGWLHKRRDLGGIAFLVLRDRSGLVQAVVKDDGEKAKLDGLQNGTVLEITGQIVADERAMGGVEIHEPKLTVVVPVTEVLPIEIDKPIDHLSENFDTLFEYRALSLRNPQEQQVFLIRAALLREIRAYLDKDNFVEIQTPKLVAGAAEGGAEVFRTDYFGQEATLAQSPQLYKQMMVGVFEKVFEIGPAFRAEPSVTTRHMSEVTMLDIEMGFIEDHDDVLQALEAMVYHVVKTVYQQFGQQLTAMGAPELVLKQRFPRYSMAKIHELYSAATGKDTTGESDLLPEEERWICEYAKEHDGCEAVFATQLPVSKMKFYHMKSADGQSAKSADLLFRGVEIATAPQREHRYDVLLEQMKAAGVDPADPGFSYYLQAFRFGLPAHGGCGFGIDRLTQLVCGLGNVKEATLFPRDTKRLTP